jgi:dynein heavy chain
MAVVLKIFFCKEIYEDDDYKFSPSGIYFAPKHTEYDGYIEFIKGLPTFPDPEIFGFHPNAAITKNQNQTNEVLNTILITMSSAGGSGGGSGDEIINTLADSILKELPSLFDVKAAEKKFPVSYE